MRTVHMKLEAAVHEKAVGYSSVSKYLCPESFGDKNAAQGETESPSHVD
jgi:hypothetical protein